MVEFEKVKTNKMVEIDNLKGDYERAFKKRSDLEIEFKKL